MSQSTKFKKTSEDSFFGNFLYGQIIPEDHFLVKLKELIDWDKFSDICLKWYRWSGDDGAAPYDPALILRILFLSYLFNMSERQIVERVNFDLTFKYFVGLGVDKKAPDHSTLSRFKDRLIIGGGKEAFDELLREILRQALNKGIRFGTIQAIDATHTIADVNTAKDAGRQSNKDKKGDPKDPKPPRDSDAKWGNKGDREIKNKETGEKKIIPQWFYGYKAHTSINTASRLITAIETTGGQASDGDYLISLVEKDNNALVLLPNRIYGADRAYDWGDNHEYLKANGFFDAIRLNDYRTKEDNKYNKIWLELKDTKEHKEGLKERYKIERNFGEEKQSHGLDRCRYLGLVKYHAQAVLTATVFNLKVVVAAITGTTLKGYAYSGNRVRLTSLSV